MDKLGPLPILHVATSMTDCVKTRRSPACHCERARMNVEPFGDGIDELSSACHCEGRFIAFITRGYVGAALRRSGAPTAEMGALDINGARPEISGGLSVVSAR